MLVYNTKTHSYKLSCGNPILWVGEETRLIPFFWLNLFSFAKVTIFYKKNKTFFAFILDLFNLIH